MDKCKSKINKERRAIPVINLHQTQVCLMSQSWDNVASMHDHLLTVHAHKT